MRCLSAKVLLLLVALFGFAIAQAASWPSAGSARKVTTLIVCSNNKSPRLLAEIIQSESKQPYLLFPAPQSDDTRIFFVPARGAAIQLTEDKLAAFIRFLSPNRIVVLGNEDFVPRRFLRTFDRNIPVFAVDADDWSRISDELGFMLNISALPRDYRRLSGEMFSDAKIYRPISKPTAKVEIKNEPQLEELAPAAPTMDEPAADNKGAAKAPTDKVPVTDKAAGQAPADQTAATDAAPTMAN